MARDPVTAHLSLERAGSDMSTNGFREELLNTYPQLLAGTYARFIDQPDPTAEHTLLLALFEVTLKYLAAVVVAQYRPLGFSDPAVDEALTRLPHPSLGHWAALLRAVLAARRHYQLPDEGCIFPDLPPLYNRASPALEAGAALLHTMRGTADNRISLRQLFDTLVEYRNSQTHGAGAGAAHVAARVPLLQAALEECLLALPSLAARGLLFVDNVSIERGGGRTVSYARLMSDRPRLRLTRRAIGPDEPHPEPQQLYLAPAHDLAGAISLHPLVVFVPACAVCGEAQVGILNGMTAHAVEYLCYGCGHTNQVAALRDDLVAFLPARPTDASPVPSAEPSPAETPTPSRPTPHNLPVEPTAFIGRERETTDLLGLLRRPEVRLVSLVGPGGTGKTRLALHAARQLLADFPDGVWFVDLSPLTDPALVPTVLGEVLRVREEGGTRLLDRLQVELADKQLLILLDNFEQVAAASSTVTSLLKATRRVKILATSRLPLHIYGEKELPVPPLALPSRDPLPPLDRLTQYEAVRLFIERAQDVRPDFAVTPDNAPAVAEICTRLDGLPLAIELAAARVKLLSPQALLVRLDQRLKLLTGGDRNLPARRQTLRGAIEWSYDLLDAGEQQLFRRLAVFQGGRTFEGMEAVCNPGGDLAVEVFEGVDSLVNKSLVQQRAGRGGEIRFWMLETIHEYAGEKLAESGEGPALARRHAAYFLTLAEEAEPHLRGEQQVEWLARLEDEHENLRAVLAWALAEAPGEEQERLLIGLRLIGALEGFWRVRGHYSEGRRWVAAALEREAQTVRATPVAEGAVLSDVLTLAKASALYTGGRLAWQQGDEAPAHRLLAESLAISRRLGDRRRGARALNDLGILAANQGANPAARAMWEESLGLWRELSDTRGMALALGNLGYLSLTEGDPATALPLLEESLSLLRELGEKSSIATGLGNVGIGALQQADYAAARALLNETLALCLELEDKSLAAHSLAALAAVELPGTILPEEQHDPAAVRGAEQKASGDPVRAATLLGAAAALLESIGAALDPMENRIYEQAAAAARALLGDEAFEAARQAGRAMTMEQATAYARQQE